MVGLLRHYCNPNETTCQLDGLIAKARTDSAQAQVQPVSERGSLPPRHTKLPARIRQEIVERYQAGEGVTNIARTLSISRDTVITHLNRANVTRRRRGMNATQINLAVRLYTEGYSLAKVGKRLGFNPSTIQARLRDQGVAIRGPHDRIR